jgi:hypothetical protein
MPNDTGLLPEALAAALGDVVADCRREWQRDLALIAAEARAATAEMKLMAAPGTGGLAELQRRIDKIEERGLLYRGTWQAADGYERGHAVTHQGALWHCNTPTRDAPGTSRHWTLMAKSAAPPRPVIA